MRAQKVKFSRLAREKGEEIGECVASTNRQIILLLSKTK